MAAWGGVPIASAWTRAMRSAKRALESSGRRFFVALSIRASRSASRRSASAAMAWAKARSSAALEVARGAVERRLERQALAQHRVEQAQAARREAVPGGPKGKEPTRYGDWEKDGLWDFWDSLQGREGFAERREGEGGVLYFLERCHQSSPGEGREE
jgi:hypothetical protein